MTNQYSENIVSKKNLLGKVFTFWTVIADDGFKRPGERHWICRCICGKERSIDSVQLVREISKSCGCYHKIRTRQLFSSSIEDLTISRVIGDYKSSANKKGHSFELSEFVMKQLLFEDCHYCGGAPKNSLSQHGRKITYQGIDRLDNARGYVPDNVVPCCIVCNKMKKTLNYGEFIQHVERIHELHKKELRLVSFSAGGGI